MAQAALYQFATEARTEAAPVLLPRVSLGLVNNMPDAAFEATERQFVTLLRAAAINCEVRIHLFSLPGVPRAGAALERLRKSYIDYSELSNLHMDGLIVTGAVPATSRVEDEPFWKPFCNLVDWASEHTLSTIWSCLAAHAAVQHIDGIRRRPLIQKLSGVFDAQLCADDPLVAKLPHRYRMPHSRYNDLAAETLMANGYTIVGQSPQAGVDVFIKKTPSKFIFMQGHPEYDGDTLMREYRRDVTRFIVGDRSSMPDIPIGYLSEKLAEQVYSIACSISRNRNPAAINRLLDLSGSVPSRGSWSPYAVGLVQSWINEIAHQKTVACKREAAL